MIEEQPPAEKFDVSTRFFSYLPQNLYWQWLLTENNFTSNGCKEIMRGMSGPSTPRSLNFVTFCYFR